MLKIEKKAKNDQKVVKNGYFWTPK